MKMSQAIYDTKTYYTRLSVKSFVLYNLIIAVVWFYFLYVRQDDYTQFDIQKLQDQISEMSARKVIVIYHEKIENRKQFKKILNKLEHTYNVVVIETNSNDSNLKKCLSQQSDHETSKNCPLIIEFKEDQSISKTQIVSEDNKVSVIVKDHQVVYPLDLDSIFFSLLEKRGEIIGHQDTQNRKTIDDIQMVHFTHNLVNPSSDYIQDESQEKLETIILEESQIILDKVYGNTFSKPQVSFYNFFKKLKGGSFLPSLMIKKNLTQVSWQVEKLYFLFFSFCNSFFQEYYKRLMSLLLPII